MAVLEARKRDIDSKDDIIFEFKKEFNISYTLANILINRGIYSKEDAAVFLYPNLDNLSDPFLLSDMDKACEKIEEAILNKNYITIYGDYDVDGMTSSALLYNYIKDRGCPVDVYIPSREEGYGLNNRAIEEIAKKGTNLIISVDCGINSFMEAEYIKELGMDLIITDHHNCEDRLPVATAIINPSRDLDYFEKNPLSGVGVVAKLVEALSSSETLVNYLDIIALGTVADIVPLIGDNRIFVHYGLKNIKNNPSFGIKALIDVAEIDKKSINTGTISFQLAPRLNAVGRINNPMLGFQLLVERDELKAFGYAKILDEQNTIRKAIEKRIVIEAEEYVEKNINLSDNKIIIIAKNDWNSGIIGIAASKLAEKYLRPTILFSVEEENLTGSARSIYGFNIYEALEKFSYLYERFGGHEQAAGLSMDIKNFSEFKESILKYCNENLKEIDLLPRFTYDSILKEEDLTIEFANELSYLEPFGRGNPRPMFYLENIKINNLQKVGSNGDHLKLKASFENVSIDGIAFGLGNKKNFLYDKLPVSLIAAYQRNEWRGRINTQLNINYIDSNFDSEEEVDLFLSEFYLNFFNAFYNNFMYNMNVDPSVFLKYSEKIKFLEIDETLKYINNGFMGTLVLINSHEFSKKFIDTNIELILNKNINLVYTQPDSYEGMGKNSIVIAPIIDKIPHNNYRHIIKLKGDLDTIIFKETHIEENIFVNNLNDYMISDFDFKEIYKFLLKTKFLRNEKLSGFVNEIQKECEIDINSFKLLIVLKIFNELEFLKLFHEDKKIDISLDDNPKFRPLDTSELYIYYKKWINSLIIKNVEA